MTREEAKSELMQIYGMLSEKKKMALDVLMAQADGDLISRQDTLNAIIKRLCISGEKYLLESERVIYQQILAMPSVAIPSADMFSDLKAEISVYENGEQSIDEMLQGIKSIISIYER